MSSFVLKIIAIVSMTADHIGYAFFPDILIFRVAGRIAFPIYAFLISEGFKKSSNRKNYALRLVLLAVLSEIPFDLVFSTSGNTMERMFDLSRQNIFFTLVCGLFAIWCLEGIEFLKIPKASFGVSILFIMAPIFLMSDYSIYGTLLIFATHVFRKKPVLMAGSLAFINFLIVMENILSGYIYRRESYIQLAAIAALPFLLMYNGKRGHSFKFFFYAYYPAHLLIIALLVYLLPR